MVDRLAIAIILGFLALAGGARAEAASSSSRASPLADLDALIAQHHLAGARIGILLVDARSGVVLASRSPDEPLPPASTAKLLMAEAALEVLGPDHRFSTELLVTGPVHAGVLEGDVVLRGGGDPDLQVTDLLGLAGRLAEAGVRRITGRLIVDDSALPRLASVNAAEFPIDDPYNAGIGALGVGFDRVKLRWRKSPDNKAIEAWTIPPLAEAEIVAASPGALPRGTLVASRTDKTGDPIWLLSRGRRASGSVDLPVRDAGLEAGALFGALAARLGVVLPEPVRGVPAGTPRPVASHESRRLVDLVAATLRYSNNQMAELIGLATSRRLAGHSLGLAESAATVLRHLQSEIPTLRSPPPVLPNHSGLAASAQITPRQLVALLVHGFAGSAEVPALPALLPTGGFEGTLERRLDGPAQVLDVWAKTGTLDGASALAGYLLEPARPPRAFAIMLAVPTRPTAAETTTPWVLRARALENDIVAGWLDAAPDVPTRGSR